MRILANVVMFALMLGLAWVPVSPADEIQSDWVGGPGLAGPVPAWGTRFAASAQASWLAVPGQVALAGSVLATPVGHLLAEAQDGAFGIAAADLDGDGDGDVVSAAEAAGDLVAWYSDGAPSPTFTAQVVDGSYPGVSGVAVADLDGDGDLDLVATTGAIASRITCYLNGGGSTPSWTPVNLETNWSEGWEIATGDVDGDGHVDVVGTNLGQNDVVWWRNDGGTPPAWTRNTVDGALSGAHSARVGDIDGDGRADILGTGTLANQVSWWRNEGGDPVIWTKRVIASPFFGGRSVRLGDLDGDGDLDAAACNFDSRIMWWANQGGSPVTWTAQLVGGVGLAHQLQMADLNGDGRLDLLVAGYGANTVVWFENGGGGAPITWTRHNVDTVLQRPLAVATGDIDGDGALEVLASSNTTHLFNWYDVTEFVPAGELTGSLIDMGAAGPFVIDWDAVVPAGTGLQVMVRAGEAPEALGPWSAPVSVPGTVIDPGGPLVQYRVLMETAETSISPLLKEVALRRSLAPSPVPGPSLGLGVHPNPANPRAVLVFEVSHEGWIALDILDLRGRLVRRLADGARPTGRHEVAWDGTDGRGRSVASGGYLARLATAGGSALTRLTLVR